MGRAKEIVVKVIPASIANPFVRKVHYSGKVVNNSFLHLGAFLDGDLHGVMSFGPSMDKRRLIGLVRGTEWSGFIELNRMAFDDYLPRNAESYCIGKAIRMIRKHAPHVKWIVSFADGTQCGDGTIYRASNFILTGITRNTTIIELPDGSTVASLVLTAHPNNPESERAKVLCGLKIGEIYPIGSYLKGGAKLKKGYMLRYVYFIDRKCRERLTVPVIPFSDIDKYGAGMYKGERIERQTRHEIKTERHLAAPEN